jgi:YD repeat-containing protein
MRRRGFLPQAVAAKNPLAETAYFEYDAVGNRTVLVAPLGEVSYYGYDALDRLAWLRADALGIDAATDYSYDAAGRLTSAYQSSPSYESDSFEYDPAGRVIARTNSAYGGTLYFQYDLAGRRTAVADPKGGVVYYTYDKRGLITRVDASWGSTFYTFDARGALLTRHLPNNSSTYYTYDAAGRLSKLEDRWDDGAPIQTFEFTRDPNGNITRSLREDGSCWYYDYDGLQRLTAADWKDAEGSTLYAFEYEYDKVGNRLRFAQNGVSTYYSYNEANELVSDLTPGVETAYYTYDGRGNQITRSVLAGHTTYFSYNSRNLISGICNTDPSFTPNYFTYNALGQRITKTDSTGTTRYLWDGLNIVLELDDSGNLTRRYTHGYSPIEGVSSLIAVEGPIRCPCFYHFDQVGGVRQLTDPYHNTIKSYAYEPFGRILAEAGAAPNDFVFPAGTMALPDVEDARLGILRLYTPNAGRWFLRDAVRFVNRYGFVLDNPLGFVDPSSRWGEGVLRTAGAVLSLPGRALEMAGGLMGGVADVGGHVPVAGDVIETAIDIPAHLTQAVGNLAQLDLPGAGREAVSAGGSALSLPVQSALVPWEAPQTLAGLAGGAIDIVTSAFTGDLKIYEVTCCVGPIKKTFLVVEGGAIPALTGRPASLGRVILGPGDLAHECGHGVQSTVLGPFYLPAVLLDYLIEGYEDSAVEQGADSIGQNLQIQQR